MVKISPTDHSAAADAARELSNRPALAGDSDSRIADAHVSSERAGQSAETTAVQGSAATGGDAVSALVAQINTGRVSMEQAVEQLLQHTVATMGGYLSGGQTAELAELLRSALTNDPTLRALQTEQR
jgi:hypothetical protein